MALTPAQLALRTEILHLANRYFQADGDNSGQIVLYTNLAYDKDGNVVEYVEPEPEPPWPVMVASDFDPGVATHSTSDCLDCMAVDFDDFNYPKY